MLQCEQELLVLDLHLSLGEREQVCEGAGSALGIPQKACSHYCLIGDKPTSSKQPFTPKPSFLHLQSGKPITYLLRLLL